MRKTNCNRRDGMALFIVLSMIIFAAVLMLNHQGAAITQQKRTLEDMHHYFASKGLIQLARLKTQQPLLHELVRATNFKIGLDPDYKLNMPYDGKINQGPVFAFKNTDGAGNARTYANAAAKVSNVKDYAEPINTFMADLTYDANSAIPTGKKYQLNTCKPGGQVTSISCVCKSRDASGNVTFVVNFSGWVQLTNTGPNKDKSIFKNFNFEEKIVQILK